MGALIALARAVAGRTLVRRGVSLLPGVGAGFGGVGLGNLAFGGDGDGGGAFKRRRRRRKALTDSDVKTALTIASAISKKAAENFILVRTRGQ